VRYLGAVALATVSFVSAPAHARRNGIVTQGCQACHGDSAASMVSLSAEPPSFGPSDLVTFTVVVERAGATVGGLYAATPEVGQLRPISGEGLSMVTGGLTHSAPKPAQNGRISFRYQWQAPSTAGSVRFSIYALAANGNNRPTGDAPGAGVFSFAFGCSAQTFYFDADDDGYGSTEFPSIVGCAGAPPRDYSVSSDDCDDGRDSVYPSARELCNGRDDDCDGRVDEDAELTELRPDPDGDGYYAASAGPSQVGCLPLTGYASEPGDCAPQDASRHPAASEICNQLDDNCDGRIDEGLRPQCGVGLCRRESVTCRVEDCVPGLPVPELCNGADDDCNGAIDDGVTCSSSLANGGSTAGGGVASVGSASLGGASGGQRAQGGLHAHGSGGSNTAESSCTLASGESAAGRAPYCAFGIVFALCLRRRATKRKLS
jgi:hypothetical protein